MKRKAVFLCLLLVSGCVAGRPSVDPTVVREASLSEEIRILHEEIARMKGRLEEMDYLIGKIAEEQSATTRKAVDALRKTREETAGLNERIGKAEKDTAGRFAVLLEEVQKENEAIRKAIASIKVPSYATGYEHVVRRGDTLSGIAKEYGSTVGAIMDANEIEDPNTLQVGQKLFVPK